MINILHLRSSDIYSSPERLIIGQCLNLEDCKPVCASFVRSNNPNRFIDECINNNIIVEKIKDSFIGDLRVIKRIREIITVHKINLLISHDYKSNFFAHFALRNQSTVHIAHFHGYTSENRRVALYNFIDKIILKRLSTIIAVSSYSKQLLIKHGIPEKKITVVPNAIDSSSILGRDDSNARSNQVINIIAAGRFSYEKGFDYLLEAIALIKDKGLDFKLHLYGSGPEELRLRRMTEEYDIIEEVNFPGFVDNILPILSDMDFLVLSSRSEGMPVIVLEAWSQGVGVISTSVGGVPELITSDKYGILVEPGNVKQLADKILWGIKNIGAMKELGNNGKELVRDEYIYEAQAKKLQNIYSVLEFDTN